MNANTAEVILLMSALIGFECSSQTENEELSVLMSARSHRRSRQETCQFLCIANKVDYLERCIKECTGRENPDEKALSGKQVFDERMRNSAITQSSRARRAVNESCTNSPDWAGESREVTGLRVDFTRSKPNLSVVWDPMQDFQLNWTSYALFYCGGSGKPQCKCKLVPKHQHEWTITDGDGWWYPNSIFLAVVTFPLNKNQKVEFGEFEPKRPLPPTIKTPKSPEKLVGAVAGGSAAGFLLLLVVMMFFRKEIRGFLCSGHSGEDDDQRHGAMPSRINNFSPSDDHPGPGIAISLKNTPQPTGPEFYYACYFPENDVFKVKIAGVVNHYRVKGYEVVMDLMDSSGLFNQLGPTRWAARQIKGARKILVFLSPGLLRLCGSDYEKVESTCQESERVWYELCLLQRIHAQTRSAAKMVCITFSDLPLDLRDLPLWAELRYTWPADNDKILMRFNDKPMLLPL